MTIHIGSYFYCADARVVQLCLELGKRCPDRQRGETWLLFLRISLEQRGDILKVECVIEIVNGQEGVRTFVSRAAEFQALVYSRFSATLPPRQTEKKR